MKSQKIPIELARRIALHALMLDGNISLPAGKEGVASFIEKLGYLQIDTIAVIERAHHHTLWTRVQDYKQEHLDELQTKDRRIFEYWAHATCYLPMSDYRYYLPRMRKYENIDSAWARQLKKDAGPLMKPIMDRIRAEGPLSSRDFESPPPKHKDAWYPRASRSALTLLFWKGDLMVTERRNFQKVFDLTERVLPPGLDTSYPSVEELGQFLVLRAFSSLGVANKKEISIFLQPDSLRDIHMQAAGKDMISSALDSLLDTGEAVPVKIEGDNGTHYYALTGTIDKAEHLELPAPGVHILSPFDNLMTRRERVRRLFDFDYTIECYVPKAKRKFGYFTLPILWGERFAGKLDPKADRKTKTLVVNNLAFESHINDFDDFLPRFAAKLTEFARFNNCEKITIEKSTPAKMKGELKKLLQ